MRKHTTDNKNQIARQKIKEQKNNNNNNTYITPSSIQIYIKHFHMISYDKLYSSFIIPYTFVIIQIHHMRLYLSVFRLTKVVEPKSCHMTNKWWHTVFVFLWARVLSTHAKTIYIHIERKKWKCIIKISLIEEQWAIYVLFFTLFSFLIYSSCLNYNPYINISRRKAKQKKKEEKNKITNMHTFIMHKLVASSKSTMKQQKITENIDRKDRFVLPFFSLLLFLSRFLFSLLLL